MPSQEQNPSLSQLLNFPHNVRRFFATKAAAQRDPTLKFLHDEESDISFMGPWEFNLHEIFLAGMPAATIVIVCNLLFSVDFSKIPSNEFYWQFEMLYKVEALLNPFLIPISTSITGYSFAWFSLNKINRSKEKIAKSFHQYLYMDGAHGLIYQSIMSIFVVFFYDPFVIHGVRTIFMLVFNLGYEGVVYFIQEYRSMLLLFLMIAMFTTGIVASKRIVDGMEYASDKPSMFFLFIFITISAMLASSATYVIASALDHVAMLLEGAST